MSVRECLSLTLSKNGCILAGLQSSPLLLRQILPLKEFLLNAEYSEGGGGLLVTYPWLESILHRVVTEALLVVSDLSERLLSRLTFFEVHAIALSPKLGRDETREVGHVLLHLSLGEEMDLSVVVVVEQGWQGAHLGVAGIGAGDGILCKMCG